MVENFGSVFYLVIYIVNLLGLAYYTYLTYLNPKQLINDYELGDDSIVIIRVVGSFVLSYVIIGIILLFTSIQGAWIYFVTGLMISSFQLLYDLGTRMNIIDNDYKVVNKTSDTIISIVFIILFNYIYSRKKYKPYSEYTHTQWIQYAIQNGFRHFMAFNVVIYSLISFRSSFVK